MKNKDSKSKKKLLPEIKPVSALNKKVVRPHGILPVVAIGASAGGMEAMIRLLTHLPADTGMAYVYIQHLDPAHESMLSVLFQKATGMQVLEAGNMMPVLQNKLYVIPPGKDMTIIDGVLKLHPRAPKPALHLPINEFFLSLAEKRKEAAIGIVLSGNANDGALGLKAIRTAGGVTFAQDASAKFQSMPKAAIAEGAVDLVLPPEQIASELVRLSSQSNVMQRVMHQDDEEIQEEEDLVTILTLLRKSTGVDFIHYKKNTIHRRVIRRMLIHKLETLKEYAQYLRQHAKELTLLYQDLLINVTSFFRDVQASEFLKETLLPSILKSKSQDDPVRIWVPACSTGEEVYSIAILLMEILKDSAANISIQIFATDLSEQALAKGRMGIYSKADLAEVSPERLQQFFTKVDGNYRIAKSIREICVFAPHNILKDPPFSRLDLISCCNVLIYLDAPLQKKLMSTFHYALNNSGYLVLGKAETTGGAATLFSQLNKKYKIYARKSDSSGKIKYESLRQLSDYTVKNLDSGKLKPQKQHVATEDLGKTVDDILLKHYVPASVVINSQLEILQFRGLTGFYLEPAPGKASLNLLKMARTGLSFDLRNAIHKSRRSGKSVRKSGIEMQYKGNMHIVSFEVYPFRNDSDEPLFLITFEEIQALKVEKLNTQRDNRVKQLEQELMETQESVHSFVEEHEATNEELQSANEEILSSNEELQSINEELETSKEEIEATNEELITINRELQLRNEQLSESYDYTQNIIDTVREAMIVLNKDLLVKSCNQGFYHLFNTTESETEGKLIYELGNHQWNIPALRELLEEIIPRNASLKDFRVSHYFESIGEKVMVLNARKVKQKMAGDELILLAIEDITEHVAAHKLVSEREHWIRNIADTAPVMMWFADTTRARTFFNKTWLNFTGKLLEEEVGKGWVEDVHPEDKDQLLKIYNHAFEEHTSYKAEYRLLHHTGTYRWQMSSANPSYDNQGNFTGFVGSVTDINDKKIAEEALRIQESRMRTVLESLPQIAFTMLPDGSVAYSNNAWYNFTGDDRKNPLQGEGRRKLGHPDDLPVFNNWIRSLKAGEPFEGEGRIRGKEGSYRWFLTRIIPVKDQEGNVIQWLGTSTDIDENKKWTQQLQLSEERFQLSTEATHAGTFDFDMVHRILYWSDSMKEINGFSKNETVSTEAADSIIHPEDKALVMDAYKEARNPSGNGNLEFEHRVIRNSDRKVIWVFVKAKVSFTGEGEMKHPVRVTGILLDITERKESEEKIQRLLELEKKLRKESEDASEKVTTILESLPQMAWMTDAEGKVIFMNRTHIEYSGMGLKEVAEGKVTAVVHSFDYRHYIKIWQQHLLSGKTFEAQVRYRRASDDTYRWQLVRATPVRDATGTIHSWVGTNTDIHDQKMFAEELERAVKQRTAELDAANFNLERSNKELQQFAFAASHDLQEPLRKIQTFTDRIVKQYRAELPGGSLDFFTRIIHAADRMRKLIEDLLNLSRATVEGKTFVNTDLEAVMQEALSNYDLSITQKNAVVTVGELPEIEAIPAQMKQLFENLLSNALKFTGLEKPLISITSRQLPTGAFKEFHHPEENGVWHEIVFSDNGIGFEQKFADHIFITFQRLHDVRKYPGTGIGLALCKKIALNHGGEIYAVSTEQQGTSFHILLPEKQKEKPDKSLSD